MDNLTLQEEAQKVRQKSLEIRKEKAEELYSWVLDLLETPTKHNTEYDIYLCKGKGVYKKRPAGNIEIGPNCIKGFTDKPFEDNVMKLLANMFENTEGYTGKYDSGSHPRVIIAIN